MLNKKRDIGRLLPLLVIAFLVFMKDLAGLKVVLFTLGTMSLMIAFSHLVRRIYFPYLDLKVYIDKANNEALPAAIVLVGIIFLMSVMIIAPLILLR